jgi:hypothetical protein
LVTPITISWAASELPAGTLAGYNTPRSILEVAFTYCVSERTTDTVGVRNPADIDFHVH